MSFRAYILTLCFFFLVISCRTKKAVSHYSESSQTTESHENTSSTRTQISDDWFSTASSLEHRSGTLAIDFDGPAVITIRPDQSIEASGANPTIRSTTASTRRDTTVSDSSHTQLIQKDTTSRGAKSVESERKIEEKDVIRTPSLTPWIGVGVAIAIVILAVLWFVFRKPKI